jgi:aryl-alcohol dehydrogenase-like predicted oxidoreductase
MYTAPNISETTLIKMPGTDLEVSRICLGTGGLGSEIDQRESAAILDTYFGLGGNFIDTAHNYGDWVKGMPKGQSERTIGRWLRTTGNRDKVTIATKGGHFHFDSPEKARLNRNDLVSDLNSSLEYLGVENIDLYWLHRDDPDLPVDGIIDTLNSFVKSGKVRWFGASNWQIGRIIEAQDYAAASGQQGFIADQSLWNAAVLAGPPYGDPSTSWMETERYCYHKQTGMAVVPYQSQAYGLFKRMYDGTLDKMNSGFRGFYKQEESTDRYTRMRAVMDQTQLSITQVTLAYLMSQPFTTVPIIGCRNVEQVADSMTALNSSLTFQQVQYIERGQ